MKINLCQIALIGQNIHQGKLCIQTHRVAQKSHMARQVAQWVSDFDFCCLVVQLRHASLIRLTGTELVAKKMYRGIEFNFGTKANGKEGFAFQLASLDICD